MQMSRGRLSGIAGLSSADYDRLKRRQDELLKIDKMYIASAPVSRRALNGQPPAPAFNPAKYRRATNSRPLTERQQVEEIIRALKRAFPW